MLRFGITGRSGTGKSTVARLFERYGVRHVDADKVAHNIYAPGTPCAAELVEHFGTGILDENGAIDRKILGPIVFADPKELAALSSITHRYVGEAIDEIERQAEADGVRGLLVDAIALLESGQARGPVVVVTAPYEVQLARIIERDGLTEEAARRRLDAQREEDFFSSKADYVIVNHGSLEDLEAQVEQVARALGLCP
ncbi:MAG: dephospho-CoA kinase [Clostridia bacterium]|nr:dephospho-CoA kinase [Clostridia bacterium]